MFTFRTIPHPGMLVTNEEQISRLGIQRLSLNTGSHLSIRSNLITDQWYVALQHAPEMTNISSHNSIVCTTEGTHGPMRCRAKTHIMMQAVFVNVDRFSLLAKHDTKSLTRTWR